MAELGLQWCLARCFWCKGSPRYGMMRYGMGYTAKYSRPFRPVDTIHLQSFLRFCLLKSYIRKEEPLHGSWLGHATMFVQANPRLMPVSPIPCRLSGGIMKYLNLLQSLMHWKFMPNLSYHVVILNLEGTKTAFTPLRRRLLFKDCIIIVCLLANTECYGRNEACSD